MCVTTDLVYMLRATHAFVQRLYELGARRVIVTGTGPLGCVPAELAMHSQNGECAVELTRAVNLFNPQMVDMVRGLNRDIGADVFVTANTYRMNFDYIANPQDFGEIRHGDYGHLHWE